MTVEQASVSLHSDQTNVAVGLTDALLLVREPRPASSTVNHAPHGLLSSTRMFALCSVRIWLTIASPRPVPRPLVEKYGRNSFSFCSAVMPQPVSAKMISTVSASPGACLDSQNLQRRILHGFGRIIDQIDHHALELLGIDRYRRQIRAPDPR